MSYVDVPTSSRHELIRLASGLPWPGGGGEEEDVGGAALLTGETNGFATDFTHPVDAERVAVKTAGTVVSSGLDAFFSNAGTSPKQVFDVSGNLVWAPHNVVLRSEDFSNASWVKQTGATVTGTNILNDPDGAQTAIVSQSVTGHVVGQNYTISVWVLKDAVTTRFPAIAAVGTGSIFISLNTSTGATAVISSNYAVASHAVEDLGTHWKVKITFVAENAATSLRIYPAHSIVFGGAANATGIGSVTVDKVQWNRGDVPTGYLTTTSAARYGLAVDYDPVTHTALGMLVEQPATNYLLNNATLSTQSVTVTAAAHTLSFRGTGTITLSGVSTAGPLVGTGASNRVSLTFTPTAGSLTLTVSGTVSNAQLELVSHPTSIIPTFAALQTRAADNPSFLLSTIPALSSEYSIYCRFSTPLASTLRNPVALTDGTANEFSRFVQVTSSMRLQVTDGGVSQASISSGVAVSANTSMSVAGRFKANDCAVSVNGTAAVADTSVTMPTLTEVRFANAGTNAAALDSFRIEKLVIVPRAWSDVELVAKSAA